VTSSHEKEEFKVRERNLEAHIKKLDADALRTEEEFAEIRTKWEHVNEIMEAKRLDHENEVSELKTKIVVLTRKSKRDNDRWKKESLDLTSKIGNLEQDIQMLESQIQSKDEEYKTMIDEFRSKCGNLEADILKKDASIQSLQNKIELLQMNLEKLQQIIDAQSEERAEMIASHAVEVSVLYLDMEDSQIRFDDAIDRFRAEASNAEFNLKELHSQKLAELNASIIDLELERDVAKHRTEEIMESNGALETELAQTVDDYEILFKKFCVDQAQQQSQWREALNHEKMKGIEAETSWKQQVERINTEHGLEFRRGS